MMEQIRCLYCGRVISEQSQYEIKNEWHKKCQKEFFGTSDFPEIDLSKDQMEKLANETVKQKITIPGVQKKLSLHLSRGEHSRLTIVDYPTGYILNRKQRSMHIYQNMKTLQCVLQRSLACRQCHLA